MIKIIGIREKPELLEQAAEFFSTCWNVPRYLYIESMTDRVATESAVPRWYLLLRGDEISGGCGLIENDFMADTEFSPWLCALFIEPHTRGAKLGARLLAHVRSDAADEGLFKIYLNTDHVGYYEKYGWRYIGDFTHQSGGQTRVYEATAE